MLHDWSARDVQRDPEGFKEARRKEREQREIEEKKQREADDLERYTREFVAAGGDPKSAEAEFKRTRNERASESARAKEEATHQGMRERRMRAV
jgi:hypothetical protein